MTTAASTKIEWAQNQDGTPGATWNAVRGCKETSPGCAKCYAKTFAERFRGVKGHPYEQGFDLRLVPEKLTHPFTFKKPTTFFVNSMSDLWFEGVPFDYIAAVFGVMAACPQHRFITLTKRDVRMVEWYEWIYKTTSDASLVSWLRDERRPTASPQVLHCMEWLGRHGPNNLQFLPNVTDAWPLPNVYVGVSVENKKHGVPRIDNLRKVPAAERVLSVEPLLEDLGELDLSGIGWVLIGGESGQGARPFQLSWAENIIAQCRAQRVPVFVKQVGAKPVISMETTGAFRTHNGKRQLQMAAQMLPTTDKKGGNPLEWPEHLRIREFPVGHHA